jgi:serine/threonine protein kinase
MPSGQEQFRVVKPGTILNNRYQLEEKAGDGGLAQVYRATDLMLGRKVAIKIMDTSLSGDINRLNRFQLEARAVAALDHPNILPIYDIGLLTDTAYLVMPFISGGTLASRLKSAGKFSLAEACTYIEQVASALDFAHSNTIIHRDVKPSNILLHKDNRPMLADFGFAKFMPDGQEEANTQALGTVQYVAPEQIRNRVSTATDQYSLGIVFYQLISGSVPFNGTPHLIVMAHLNQAPPPLRTQPALAGVDPVILERLDLVIGRAMAKTAPERFATCSEFAEACRIALYPEQPFPPELALMCQVQPLVVPLLSPVQPPIQPEPDENAATEAFEVVQPEVVPPAIPRLLKPARLQIYTQPRQGFEASFNLQDAQLKLGRETNMELQVPLATVSRHHANFYRVSNGVTHTYRIVDNKSRNGLSYEGKFIKERVLQNGDVIQIGQPGYCDYVIFLVYSAPVFG